MQEKLEKFGVVLCALVFLTIAAAILYHHVGWFQGDLLEYVKEHYAPDGKVIVDGEYLATGEDEQGGFVIYRVTTEDGASHFLRIQVVFHRYLAQVGPEFKIRGICEIDHFEVMTEPG